VAPPRLPRIDRAGDRDRGTGLSDADGIGQDERRALTPMFWSNINFYGRFRLDMNTRLNLSSTGPTRQPESVL